MDCTAFKADKSDSFDDWSILLRMSMIFKIFPTLQVKFRKTLFESCVSSPSTNFFILKTGLQC